MRFRCDGTGRVNAWSLWASGRQSSRPGDRFVSALGKKDRLIAEQQSKILIPARHSKQIELSRIDIRAGFHRAHVTRVRVARRPGRRSRADRPLKPRVSDGRGVPSSIFQSERQRQARREGFDRETGIRRLGQFKLYERMNPRRARIDCKPCRIRKLCLDDWVTIPAIEMGQSR